MSDFVDGLLFRLLQVSAFIERIFLEKEVNFVGAFEEVAVSLVLEGIFSLVVRWQYKNIEQYYTMYISINTVWSRVLKTEIVFGSKAFSNPSASSRRRSTS